MDGECQGGPLARSPAPVTTPSSSEYSSVLTSGLGGCEAGTARRNEEVAAAPSDSRLSLESVLWWTDFLALADPAALVVPQRPQTAPMQVRFGSGNVASLHPGRCACGRRTQRGQSCTCGALDAGSFRKVQVAEDLRRLFISFGGLQETRARDSVCVDELANFLLGRQQRTPMAREDVSCGSTSPWTLTLPRLWWWSPLPVGY